MRHLALLLLRLGFAGSMIPHGYGKFIKLLDGNFTFADPIGIGQTPSLILATFSEFICPLLIIIGFKTKLASIPLAITMAVAAFITHFNDPWGKKEMAFLYLIAFTTIALLGPGRYSLDRK